MNELSEIFSFIINKKIYKRIIFSGTSAGAFPSIVFASHFNAFAIISNCQLYLENYNKNIFCHIRHIKRMLDDDDEVIYKNKMIEKNNITITSKTNLLLSKYK
jgi:hypothetical protein